MAIGEIFFGQNRKNFSRFKKYRFSCLIRGSIKKCIFFRNSIFVARSFIQLIWPNGWYDSYYTLERTHLTLEAKYFIVQGNSRKTNDVSTTYGVKTSTGTIHGSLKIKGRILENMADASNTGLNQKHLIRACGQKICTKNMSTTPRIPTMLQQIKF